MPYLSTIIVPTWLSAACITKKSERWSTGRKPLERTRPCGPKTEMSRKAAYKSIHIICWPAGTLTTGHHSFYQDIKISR
ncbi:hypothetical protein EDD21DRAFT_385999 [Dissophora ornata]|nr:hypothetical protein EDD21DRAFT_385999 [Dissophora ornata]